eukprot:GHVU01188775.1.p2 GENE.GHVU01188775.1~~GHVU01188775.1.p2  ORF type:complete len:129 (+),score=12.22 GHVU01188775.1:204-590(+)
MGERGMDALRERQQRQRWMALSPYRLAHTHTFRDTTDLESYSISGGGTRRTVAPTAAGSYMLLMCLHVCTHARTFPNRVPVLSHHPSQSPTIHRLTSCRFWELRVAPVGAQNPVSASSASSSCCCNAS